LSPPSVEPRLPSWWLEDALGREGDPAPAPALSGDSTADVAIVGGGYTGLWTALALREQAPGLRIALLEAEICGHGPSGRNGGFLHGYWAALASTLPVLGEERALELARAGERIIPGIRAWAEQRGEDVWLREAGMLEVSAAPAQDGSAEKAVGAAARVGRPDQAVGLTPEEVAQRVSSPVFRGGVFYPECATVHPGLLVRALRRAALDAGVTVHEGTPVTAVRAGAPNELETPRGILRAPDVVLATNAPLTGWAPASRNLTNFGSYVVLTEPAPERLAEIGWIDSGGGFSHLFSRPSYQDTLPLNSTHIPAGQRGRPRRWLRRRLGRFVRRGSGRHPHRSRHQQALRPHLPAHRHPRHRPRGPRHLEARRQVGPGREGRRSPGCRRNRPRERCPPPPRVLRRAVSTHLHRPGRGDRTEADHLRRARLGPRRLGPGPDPETCSRT